MFYSGKYIVAINSFINKIAFYEIMKLPIIVLFVITTSVILMIKLKFINVFKIQEAFRIIAGKKVGKVGGNNDSTEDNNTIQVSSITALFSQMAGNLGLGNISGAAFGIYFGGPGVAVWVIIWGLILSIIRFSEITLGHRNRYVDENGVIHSGMFFVLRNKAKDSKNKKILTVVAAALAVITVAVPMAWSSFQLNQISGILGRVTHSFMVDHSFSTETLNIIFIASSGLFVTIILLGGIKRVGAICDMIVPFMAVGYLLLCTACYIVHRQNFIPSLKVIIESAFTLKAGLTGTIAMIAIAMQRMLFSSEAGVGTAAIIHANADVKISCQQGFIAFLDCLIIGFIVACGILAIMVSGVDYTDKNVHGIILIEKTFSTISAHSIYVLAVIAVLFGVTTVLANGFYAQKAFYFLCKGIPQKLVVVVYIIVASYLGFTNALLLVGLADVLALIILVPNCLILLIYVNEIKEDVVLYFSSLANYKAEKRKT